MSAISALIDNLHIADIDRRSALSAPRAALMIPWHRTCQLSGIDSNRSQHTHCRPSPAIGWMKAVRHTAAEANLSPGLLPHEMKLEVDEIKNAASNIEHTSLSAHLSSQQLHLLPLAHQDTPDSALPFLSASQLALLSDRHDSTSAAPLYIVINDIVYDCTQFVWDHPGGPRVIESFRGQDCSWQFWRFHSKENMAELGQCLRVARTQGVRNRWKERPRFVGLRKFGAAAEEDW